MKDKRVAMPHPMQPLGHDEEGTVRFKQNKIVRNLLDFASERGFGLSEIASRGYSPEDVEQLFQLLGYSFNGFADLSFVRDSTIKTAGKNFNSLLKGNRKR